MGVVGLIPPTSYYLVDGDITRPQLKRYIGFGVCGRVCVCARVCNNAKVTISVSGHDNPNSTKCMLGD